MGLSCLHEGVVQLGKFFHWAMQFPSQLADIGDPKGAHIDPRYRDLLCRHPGKTVVIGQPGIGQTCKHLT